MWNVDQSHEHSLQTLNILNEFDEFKSSIKHLADFGCGAGKDLDFFANMRELPADDDPNILGKFLNFNCVGFDLHAESNIPSRNNIKYKNVDLNKPGPYWSVPFDVIWCHDVLQSIYSPVEFLGRVNENLNIGGMLYLHVPSTVNVLHHQFQNYTPAYSYNTFTVTQIIYLLALNGFDVKDFYLNKHKFDDNIEIVAYKERDPLPYGTSWYELAEQDILSSEMEQLIVSNNLLSDQGLVTKWLDGSMQDYRWHTS